MGKFSDIYNAEKSTSKTTSKSNTTSKKTFSQMYNEERKKKEEEQKKASSVSTTSTPSKTATHGGSGGKSYNNNYEIQNDDWNKLTAVSKNDSTSRGAYASLSRKGYTDEYINNYSKIAGYGNLKNNADYAENSKGDNVYKEEYKNQNAYTNYTASTTGDSNLPIFSYVPDKDKTKDLNVLNDEERSNFNYLYNTKGRESAEEYYDTIINDVNKRRQKEEIAKMESDYEQMSPTAQAVVGVGGTVAGFVGQTLGNTIATAKDAYDMASSFSNNLTNYINERKQNGTDENTPFLTNAWNTFKDINGMVKDYEINPYDEYHDMKNEVSAFRNMIGNKIEQNTELEFMGQNVARKAYEIINSAADSKIGGLAFGAPYTVLMGVNAFTDRVEEGVKNGEDKEVALKKASIEGAAETLSEIISLELILKTGIGKNFVETAWNFIKLGIDEGSEEVASDLFKDFWESKVDKWYGEVPEMQQQVQTLVANGMDEKSAEKQVIKEKIRELGWSFISGAGAGLLGGTGATIANVNNVRTLGKDIREKGETENVLKTIAENTKGKVKTASQEYLAKIGRKEKLSDLNVGGLTAQAIEQLDEEYAKNKKAYDKEDKSIEKAKAEQMEIDAKNKKADSENDFVKMAISNPAISINGKTTTINGNNVVNGKYDSTKTSVFTDVGGKAVAKGTVDGKTYTAKDIADNAKDYNVKALYGYIAENNLLSDQANFLVNNYDGESNVDAYVKAYDAFKKAGEIGASDGYLDVVISKTYSDYFTKEQQDKIMSASLANRPLKVGLTDYTTKAKSNSTKVQMKVVDSIAKALGKEVVLFDDLQKDLGDKIRGYNGANFGNGRIALSAQAEGGLILRSFAHEIGHSIKQSDSKAFAELREVVQATAQAKGIDLKKDVQKYKDSGYDESQIYDELICDSLYNVLFDEKVLRKVLGNNISSIALSKAVKKILPIYDSTINMMIKGGKSELAMLNDNKEALRKISDIFASADKSGVKETTETEEGTFRELDDVDFDIMEENGITIDESDSAALSTRYALDYDKRNEIAKQLAVRLGKTQKECKKWIEDNFSITALVMGDTEHLEYEADDNYSAFKNNSDYPWGAVDFNTNCPKRRGYTEVYDRLQQKFPSLKFNAFELAMLRKVCLDNGMQVACGLCFVEDRRQLLGTIADDYIKMVNKSRKTGKTITKVNSAGKETALYVTKKIADEFGKSLGVKQGDEIVITDDYQVTQYDLGTYDGFSQLRKNHPQIAMGYIAFNNSRGQQAGRLIEGRAEYKRQILDFTDAQVQKINDNGGLRIFSFSDFEAVHTVDLIQIIEDCAVKGIKIQAYTKQLMFARLVKGTGLKLNRSLIPAGLGYDADGNLIYDAVEGVDINSKDFKETSGDKDIGNVLVGINDKQIRLAMESDFIDYIIPFHTGQNRRILEIKSVTRDWKNYKNFQNDRDRSTNKNTKKNVNIYTDVIDKYGVSNKNAKAQGYASAEEMFTKCFLKECNERKLIPRFAEDKKGNTLFCNKDANGDYVYTKGYYKFLVDYKLFDAKTGEMYEQRAVTPQFDIEAIKEHIIEPQRVAEQRFQDDKAKRDASVEDYTNLIRSGKLKEIDADTKYKWKHKQDLGLKPSIKQQASSFSTRVLMGTEFSGGGMVEAGLVYKMLQKEFAVEWKQSIATVYMDNFGKEHVYAGETNGDVFKFDSSKHKLFYFHASPVCHNFSTAKHNRKELQMDIDSAKKVVKDITNTQPTVVSIENAPGYINSQSAQIIMDGLKKLGYDADIGVYKTSDYGGATIRERCIIRAVKGTLPKLPTKSKAKSWNEVTSDLWDSLPNKYAPRSKTTFSPSYTQAIMGTPQVMSMLKGDKSYDGIMNGRIDVDEPLLLLQTNSGKNVSFSKLNEPCKTLTTHCYDATLLLPGGKILQATPRFLARIQGLPDSYKLDASSKSTAYTIIGNGVPVELTKAVMGGLLESAYEQTYGEALYSTRDSEYISSVQSGDMAKAQKMVDDAAREKISYEVDEKTKRIETLSDSELDELVTKVGWLNSIAYKGYGKLSQNQQEHNSLIYKTKGEAIYKIAKEFKKRGKDVSFYGGVLYFRKNNGIQISFHTSSGIGFSNENIKNLVGVKETSWDGIRNSFAYTDPKEYSNKVEQYNNALEIAREGISEINEKLYSYLSKYNRMSKYNIKSLGDFGVYHSVGINENYNNREIFSRVFGTSDMVGFINSTINDLLKNNGLDFKFDYNNNEVSEVNPKTFKSAETVTHDDNGNIIPLSERFNSSNPDIRYSARDVDGQISFEDVPNSDAQEVEQLTFDTANFTTEEQIKKDSDSELVDKIKEFSRHYQDKEKMYKFFDENPSLDFVERYANKETDKFVKTDFKRLFSLIDSETDLNLVSAIYRRLTYNKVFDTHRIASVHEYRGAEKWIKTMITKRRLEIEKTAGENTSLGMKGIVYDSKQIHEMFNKVNKDKDLEELANRVFATTEKLGIKFKGDANYKDSSTGGTSLGHRVRYDMYYMNNSYNSDVNKATTLLHEAIHACTTYALKNTNDLSDPNMQRAAEIIKGVYDKISGLPILVGEYGIQDSYEMTAELANERFRNKMRQIDVGGSDALDTISTAIKIIFNIDANDSLSMASIALDYIIDHPDAEKSKDYYDYAHKVQGQFYDTWNFSVRDDMSGYYSEVIRENRRLQTILASLGDAYSSIRKDTYVSKDRVRSYAQELVNKYNSTMDVNALTDRIYAVYDWIDAQRKTNKGYQVVDTEQAVMPLREIANDIMMTSTVVDTTKYDMSRPLRKYLREHTLYVTEEESREIPDFMAEKKLLGGRVRVSIGEYDNRGNKRVHLADAWNILCELSGGTEVDGGYEYVGGELNPDTNQKDMLRELFEYFQSHEKTFVTGDQAINAMFNMGMLDSTEAEADVLASEMLENHLKMISEKEPTANQKLTAFLHDLEAQTVQLRENYKNDAKKSYEEKLQAYKDKREMLDDKRVLRNKIQRDYNYVSRRWREQSAQYHITENMKGLAEKYLKSFVMANPKAQVTRFDKVAMSDLARQMRLDFKDDADIVELAQKLENFSNEYHEAKYKGYAYDTDALANISVEDLQTISNVSAFIKHRIEVENNLVGERRKEDLKVVAESVHKEYSSMADKTIANINPNDSTKARIWSMSNKINLGLTKPYYLVQNCGSSTMKGLLQDILYAENTEGRILDGAKQAIVKAKENNKYDPRWKDTKVKLTLGGQFTEITVEDAMSLYALSKRPQALQHLLSDGIEIYSVNKDGDRELVKRRMLIDELRYLSETVLPDNAKSYVDEVVGYITKEIGSERNKITEALYGFKKYTEEYYFPIKVSSNERDANSVRSEELSALKNGSATKSVSENAKQAIVVDGFSDTVYNHIYTSAMYCAYVLPIENFTKVLNYRYNPNYGEIYGDVLQGGKIATKWDIQTDIKTKMGTNYFSSIMDLVRDVNSGNISPQKLVLMNKFITNMKKASTMANISVVVQQPMAVVRAFMYVEPKYFGKTTKADMDEMYANNGAALKKDIGYFDVNMGRSVTDWLDGDYTPSEDLQMTFKERVKSGEIKDTINELAGWGANKADEITWVAIWKACRNKVKAENGNLSEADQMAKASKLFSNVVGFTQVYDSVFSKCSHMRNKDSAAQMLMSFKAEPITTLNMIAQASHDYITNKNNYTKKRFFTALTCFVGSMVATNLTKAMWGAFRDDDDEYSWLEKVIAKLSGGVIGDVFGLLPYLGDIYNVMQGYDITRMDTNWISTLIGVVNQATKEDVDGTKLINKILELLSQLSGYPIYAAKRDATTIIRTGKNVISDVIGYRDMPTTTADGMIEALQDEFSFLN